MWMLKINQQEDTYPKLGRIIGIPGPTSSSIRKHGIALFLLGLVSTTLLVVVSRTTFFGNYCSNLHINDIDLCLQLSSIVAVSACFAAFVTISGLGIGLVEIISISSWNEVEGAKPLIILIATWIVFVSVLCLLINQTFGV